MNNDAIDYLYNGIVMNFNSNLLLKYIKARSIIIIFKPYKWFNWQLKFIEYLPFI